MRDMNFLGFYKRQIYFGFFVKITTGGGISAILSALSNQNPISFFPIKYTYQRSANHMIRSESEFAANKNIRVYWRIIAGIYYKSRVIDHFW